MYPARTPLFTHTQTIKERPGQETTATRVAAPCTVFAAGRRHVHQHTPAGIRVNKVRNHTRIIVGGADVRQEERILLLSCHDNEVRSAWARKIRKTETGKLSMTRQCKWGWLPHRHCLVTLEAAGCNRHSRRRDIKTARKAPERTGGKQIAWGAVAANGAVHDRFGEIRQQTRPYFWHEKGEPRSTAPVEGVMRD